MPLLNQLMKDKVLVFDYFTKKDNNDVILLSPASVEKAIHETQVVSVHSHILDIVCAIAATDPSLSHAPFLLSFKLSELALNAFPEDILSHFLKKPACRLLPGLHSRVGVYSLLQ